MFKKVKNAALALWCAALPFLTQVTMSGGSVALESAEVSSLGTAIANGATSLVNMAITILPIALWFTVVMIIYRVIWWWSGLKNKLARKKGR